MLDFRGYFINCPWPGEALVYISCPNLQNRKSLCLNIRFMGCAATNIETDMASEYGEGFKEKTTQIT